MIPQSLLNNAIQHNIQAALQEDIGTGDITALLIPHDNVGRARVITREPMVLAGTPWINALFQQLDPQVIIEWQAQEGEYLSANAPFLIKGQRVHGLLLPFPIRFWVVCVAELQIIST